MSGTPSRRAAGNPRLKSRFLNGLREQLQGLYALLGDVAEDEDVRESVLFTLEQLARTAASLEFTLLSAALENARERLKIGDFTDILTEVMLVAFSLQGSRPFDPIAIIGTKEQVQFIAQQDDQTCEPLYTFDSVSAMSSRLAVSFPQAVVLPASMASQVFEVGARFGAVVYLYGPSRDAEARNLATASGASGYIGEPVVLPELLSMIRFENSRPRTKPFVVVMGDSIWAQSAVEQLQAVGMDARNGGVYANVGAILHGLYPEAVVLGPGEEQAQVQAIRVMRHHAGRSHVVLMTVGSRSLLTAGADDVVSLKDDLALRVRSRLARFRDFRRDRDDLTHVLNRPGFLEALQRCAAWSERSRTLLSVVMIRVMGLEAAAQEFGRDAANACRRHLAAALVRGVRRHDLVGYLGHNLFVVALVECDQDDAVARMTVLRDSFEKRVHADRRLRAIRVDLGVTDSCRGLPGIMLRAEKALTAER